MTKRGAASEEDILVSLAKVQRLQILSIWRRSSPSGAPQVGGQGPRRHCKYSLASRMPCLASAEVRQVSTSRVNGLPLASVL
eukprot:2317962-Amphidinium_carterae.1